MEADCVGAKAELYFLLMRDLGNEYSWLILSMQED